MKLRHLARQAAVQVVTSLLLAEQKPSEAIEYIKTEFAPRLHKDEFLREVVDGVLNNRESIDEKIEQFAPEWPIAKLNPVERAILEIGSYEIMFTETPVAVIINEAVELAKEFGDESAPRFINGVLSSISKDNDSKAKQASE